MKEKSFRSLISRYILVEWKNVLVFCVAKWSYLDEPYREGKRREKIKYAGKNRKNARTQMIRKWIYWVSEDKKINLSRKIVEKQNNHAKKEPSGSWRNGIIIIIIRNQGFFGGYPNFLERSSQKEKEIKTGTRIRERLVRRTALPGNPRPS